MIPFPSMNFSQPFLQPLFLRFFSIPNSFLNYSSCFTLTSLRFFFLLPFSLFFFFLSFSSFFFFLFLSFFLPFSLFFFFLFLHHPNLYLPSASSSWWWQGPFFLPRQNPTSGSCHEIMGTSPGERITKHFLLSFSSSYPYSCFFLSLFFFIPFSNPFLLTLKSVDEGIE